MGAVDCVAITSILTFLILDAVYVKSVSDQLYGLTRVLVASEDRIQLLSSLLYFHRILLVYAKRGPFYLK